MKSSYRPSGLTRLSLGPFRATIIAAVDTQPSTRVRSHAWPDPNSVLLVEKRPRKALIISIAVAITLSAWLCASPTRAAEDGSVNVEPSATGEVVLATGCKFPEGASLSGDRKTLYFVNVQSSAVSRLDIASSRLDAAWVTLPDGGKGNGAAVGADGDLYVCDVGRKLIARISTATGAVSTVVDKDPDGKPFLGPNDIVFARDGTFYFTDPNGSWRAPIGAIYHYKPKSATVSLVAGGLLFPNGVALSLDNRTLYCGESPKGEISAISLDKDGEARTAQRNVLIHIADNANPDGIRVDSNGDLYVASFGNAAILKISSTGRILARFPLAAGKNVTNLALDERVKVMYITETQSNSILRLSLLMNGKR